MYLFHLCSCLFWKSGEQASSSIYLDSLETCLELLSLGFFINMQETREQDLLKQENFQSEAKMLNVTVYSLNKCIYIFWLPQQCGGSSANCLTDWLMKKTPVLRIDRLCSTVVCICVNLPCCGSEADAVLSECSVSHQNICCHLPWLSLSVCVKMLLPFLGWSNCPNYQDPSTIMLPFHSVIFGFLARNG